VPRSNRTGSADLIDGTPMAPIDWPEAIAALDRGRLPCSGGEDRMLRLAARLAVGIPVDLRAALTGPDSHNAEDELHPAPYCRPWPTAAHERPSVEVAAELPAHAAAVSARGNAARAREP
jgi:hypothetical protein